MAEMWTRVAQHISNTATKRTPPRGVTAGEDFMGFPYIEAFRIQRQENNNLRPVNRSRVVLLSRYRGG